MGHLPQKMVWRRRRGQFNFRLSASNSHLHQERGEKEGEIKFSAHSLLPDKKASENYSFPLQLSPPPSPPPHLRPKDQFLIWKVGKEEAKLRKNKFEAYWREKSICFSPLFAFFSASSKSGQNKCRENLKYCPDFYTSLSKTPREKQKKINNPHGGCLLFFFSGHFCFPKARSTIIAPR